MRSVPILRVETPEYVVFEYELAGVVRRAGAWGIDILVIGALSVSVWVALAFGAALVGEVALALGLVAHFFIQWGYFAGFEWAWRGQTPGKKAMGLRVLEETGVDLGFYPAVVRNLLRVLDSLPAGYLVGGAVSLFANDRQRLGDLLAGTVVVRDRRRPVPSAVVPPDERYNTFLEDTRALNIARRVVTPELREVMTSLALRREELETEARLALFAEVAERLEAVGVPRPRALSDERYVLSATAAVLS